MNPTIETIRAHRSIRTYTNDPIPQSHIDEAMLCGQAAATSSAVQPYCVLRITDNDKRQVIADLCGPQQKVRDCPAFFIICGDLRKHMLVLDRADTPYKSSLEAFLVASIDASLFAQNFTLAFESLGYGTCYIGGIRNDLPQLDKLLNLPEGVLPFYGLCVGVPAETPSHRPRFAQHSMLFENEYPSDTQTLANIDQYDDAYKAYLEQRGAKPNTWSASIEKKFRYAAREGLGSYFESKGAKFT